MTHEEIEALRASRLLWKNKHAEARVTIDRLNATIREQLASINRLTKERDEVERAYEERNETVCILRARLAAMQAAVVDAA